MIVLLLNYENNKESEKNWGKIYETYVIYIWNIYENIWKNVNFYDPNLLIYSSNIINNKMLLKVFRSKSAHKVY